MKRNPHDEVYWSKEQQKTHLSAVRSNELLSHIKRVEEAYRKMREATFQSHSAHFDKTGGSGSGCPECLRMRSLRDEAEKIFAG